MVNRVLPRTDWALRLILTVPWMQDPSFFVLRAPFDAPMDQESPTAIIASVAAVLVTFLCGIVFLVVLVLAGEQLP